MHKVPLGFYSIIIACSYNNLISWIGNAKFIHDLLIQPKLSEESTLSLIYLLVGLVILFVQLISSISLFYRSNLSRNIFVLCTSFSILHFSCQLILDFISGGKYRISNRTAPLYLVENVLFLTYVFLPSVNTFLSGTASSTVSTDNANRQLLKKFVLVTAILGFITPSVFLMVTALFPKNVNHNLMLFWPTALILMFTKFFPVSSGLARFLLVVSVLGNVLCYIIAGYLLFCFVILCKKIMAGSSAV